MAYVRVLIIPNLDYFVTPVCADRCSAHTGRAGHYSLVSSGSLYIFRVDDCLRVGINGANLTSYKHTAE